MVRVRVEVCGGGGGGAGAAVQVLVNVDAAVGFDRVKRGELARGRVDGSGGLSGGLSEEDGLEEVECRCLVGDGTRSLTGLEAEGLETVEDGHESPGRSGGRRSIVHGDRKRYFLGVECMVVMGE